MIKVLKPGFYSTIQDQGRFGYRSYGVPVSGVMDRYSSGYANAILGNNSDAAVLEITMTGPTLEFQESTQIVLSGADMSPILNTIPIEINAVIGIKTNDILSFGRLKKGVRTYLSIKGGFLTETKLGSMSMYNGMTNKFRLVKGDTLEYMSLYNEHQIKNAKIKHDDSVLNTDVLEVMKGPEFDKLSKLEQSELLKSNLIVSKLNNRMAYQLEPLFKNNLESILTAPVLPGTVQLTPSGQLIVLMRDCQTTGGYPRVLQLTEGSIDILSQKTSGSSLKIRLKG